MKNITDLLNKYRECIRNLWNTYFFFDEELSSYSEDILDRFADIDHHIFATIVLSKISKLDCASEYHRENVSDPIRFLRVVPSVSHGVPIMINRSGPVATGYWDDPVAQVIPSEVDLRYIGLYDFNSYGFLDCKYYRVRIVSFSSQPHLVGRDALIETNNAHVFVDYDEANTSK